MRVHRIRVPGLREGEVRLLGAEAHHLRDVLRVRPGAPVRGFDGGGHEAAGIVGAVDETSVTLRFEAPHPATVEAPVRLTLAVALLKGDKLAEVVRRGTELGAWRFATFTCRRGDVPSVSPAKLARWRRVAQEAAKQSGRALVPEVLEPVALDALVLDGPALVADPRAEATLGEALGSVEADRLTLVTGPEGGLTEGEVEALVARGARSVRLGPRILRAETAPIALAAAVLLPEAW